MLAVQVDIELVVQGRCCGLVVVVVAMAEVLYLGLASFC